ncbi:MAG: NAD(P)-dependent oxidoreductase, partial [Rhodobacteraceae bacterium]|nr:NAD(P)-dependent oxidoreductase [Paracoccaceae bacterium]
MQVSVTDITTADYPTAAQRPLNSRLDCSRIFADFAIKEPEW